MERKLAIIHTSPFTIEPLRELTEKYLPGWETINLLDDSILPQLGRNGGDVGEIAPRWRQYAITAESLGAACVISACSSVGELTRLVQGEVGIPLFRIDEAMAEEAVGMASVIGVAATLETTLLPTSRLIMDKADQAGMTVQLVTRLADSAYAKLAAGDRAGHDAELRAVLRELAAEADVVVLAQASMARAVADLPVIERSVYLTSPEMGIAWISKRIGNG